MFILFQCFIYILYYEIYILVTMIMFKGFLNRRDQKRYILNIIITKINISNFLKYQNCGLVLSKENLQRNYQQRFKPFSIDKNHPQTQTNNFYIYFKLNFFFKNLVCIYSVSYSINFLQHLIPQLPFDGFNSNN